MSRTIPPPPVPHAAPVVRRPAAAGRATTALPSAAPEGRTNSPDARAATRWTMWGVALVAAVHLWVISAGWGVGFWPQYTAHYDRLAEAFLHNQSNLLTAPDPRLLALPDPYDPAANRLFRAREGVHDTVLFGDKLYLYWGPVPALLMAAAKGVTGWRGGGDQYLVFAFAFGTVAFTGLLARRLWERFFADQPPWTIFVGVVTAGLSAPLAYLLARSAVYEAAIMGGQFFLLAGVYLLCAKVPPAASSAGRWKLRRPDVKLPGANDPIVGALLGGRLIRPRRLAGRPIPGAEPADPLPGSFRLAVVGACWALAVGSRVSLAPAVMVLAALVGVWVVRRSWRDGREIDLVRLFALGLPLAAGAFGLGAYNHARFGEWSEFGQSYQLAGANLRAVPHLFSPANLPPNLYSYLLRPVWVLHAFPYLMARGGEGTFPPVLRLPADYQYYEPIAGVLWAVPFLWLALVPVVSFARRGGRAALGPDLPRVLLWLLTASLLGFAPVLFMIGSTQRYLADLAPCLMLVAMVGVWVRGQRLDRVSSPVDCGSAESPGTAVPRLSERTTTRQSGNRFPQRGRFYFVVGVLAAASVASGVLLAFTGYEDHFRTFHPQAFGPASYRTGVPVIGHGPQN